MRTVYNTHRTTLNWSYCNDKKKSWLIKHLMNAACHSGKFEKKKLRQLSLQQLENLHSNDHEGKPFVTL